MKNNPWEKKKLPFKQAILWIGFSTVLVSGSVAVVMLYYFHVQEIQLQDDRFNICFIVQIGSGKEQVSTAYLAEILNLSADVKTHLIDFKTDQAERKLLESPIILSAKVRKQKPDTIEIDYTLRKPCFRVMDFTNAAVDEEGRFLPQSPFFHCEDLPELYLGNFEEVPFWGDQVGGGRMRLAFEILQSFKKIDLLECLEIKCVDVSRVDAPSFGEREAVLTCRDVAIGNEWVLRLRAEDLEIQLKQFMSLFEYLLEEGASSKMIDLRVSHLAFMQDL